MSARDYRHGTAGAGPSSARFRTFPGDGPVLATSADVTRPPDSFPRPDPTGTPRGPVQATAEAHLRLVLESVPDYAIITLDPQGRVTSWNSGARGMTGYTAEDIVGKSLAALYTPEQQAQGKPGIELAQALEAGRAEDEGWRQRKDGSRFWANEVLAPLWDAAGALVGFSKVSRDLTDRRRAQELLQDREERLALVVDSADYAIFTLDCEGRITSWNPGAERTFGYPRDEVLGQSGAIVFTPEDRAHGVHEEEMRRARESGRAEDERWHVTRQGDRFYASGVLAPLRAGGVMKGYVKVARDRTDRKHLEDALRLAREAAETASRAKDEFLAMLGHELRNPLAPMVTALQVMRLRGQASYEQEILERQVSHLTRMVDDLLDVSRITRGAVDLQRRPIELREVVNPALELAGPLLEQRRSHVDVQVPWRGAAVEADRDRLAQVVANLLTNAAKYSEPGSRIGLRGERDGAVVRVTVEDEGVGLAHDMIGTVFEPFVQQPQSIERSEGGLGLGLAIVRSLVEAHGGVVRAESDGLDQGSRFIVELPAVEPGAAPAAVPPSPAWRPAGRGRVLVVDDNRDAVAMLRVALERLGYAVEVAFDGPSALERAAAFEPGIVLLDIGLPVMDGYEVARRLRSAQAAGQPLRLLALTGYGQAADRERALAAGFEHHFVKPIELHDLQTWLSRPPPAAGQA
jgi:PAS domain S-box-containing protein